VEPSCHVGTLRTRPLCYGASRGANYRVRSAERAKRVRTTMGAYAANLV
jgi:hypothetical protein